MTRRKGAGGKPPKHGARMLERLLGENRLDGRQRTAKLLRIVSDDLAADAGGWEHLTNREKLLIQRCAAQAVILQSIEHFVFSQGALLDSNGAMLAPLRKGYISHLNSLRLNLVALGLRPEQMKQLPSLDQYQAQFQDQQSPSMSHDDQTNTEHDKSFIEHAQNSDSEDA